MFRSLPIVLISACFLGLVASASAADDRDRCTSSIDDDALAACTRLIRINPKNAEAFINRGNVNLARGERDGAIADFSEAIRLNPKNAYAFARRCAAYQAKAEPDQAIPDCTEAIRLDPT